MDIKIDALIPFDTLQTDMEHVFSIVEKNGKVVLLKDNKPVYIILKYDASQPSATNTIPTETASYTLQEAMKIVLSEAENFTMHASKLADEIYERRLYLQKNGKKAQYTQIRARCGHYPDMFEALPGNYIYLQVLQHWQQEIHAPCESVRRKVYPQQFLHDLLDALMLRAIENNEIALRDLGLFSKIILDVEQTYVSIDSPRRYREMLNFLSNIAQNSYELEPIDYITKDDAVNISTIHKVKGLEFPVVFVADLVSQRFPGRNETYNGLIPQPLMMNAISRGAYGCRVQDEARLFYTAITRAERILYMSGSTSHPGLKRGKRRSQFIINLNHPNMREDLTFDELAEKMEPTPRFADSELPTDYSSVKKYLKCPYSYKLSTIYGYNAAVPELFGFGKTSHTILERLHQKFKDRTPTADEVEEIVESTFMLKHVFPSNDPVNRPGSYERAKQLVQRIMTEYSYRYASDFGRLRQDEARFEISVKDALITGAIDLLLLEDPKRGIITADVIDFKSMETPEDVASYDWRDMSVQVQLYSKAAKEVLGENVETGYIHTLKDNQRTAVPVDNQSVNNAIGVIEWAVKGILIGDFPMRACPQNCVSCDFKAMCAQKLQAFKNTETPPQINTPAGLKTIAALDIESEGGY
jgi:DNA helicase-2/ATP-dependent DNA helicase PcrA